MAALEVLVVDDDDADRKLIRRLISTSGVEVNLREASGAEAARNLTEGELDAVFLDYLLPGVNGLSLLGELRRQWPQVALILMTGQGDEKVAKSAIMQGANDYVPKGALNPGEMARILNGAVEAARLRWRLEEQRRELATFSEVLVHDLKAPIRAAKFLAERAVEEAEAGDGPAALEALRMMDRSIGQIGALIESLDAHTRFDRMQEPEEIAVSELLDRVSAALERDIAECGARLRLEAEVTSVVCFPAQAVQLLQNLVANAIKYCHQKPAVLIRTSRLGPDMTLFEVQDNGPGIPEIYREKIFEPFTRAAGAGAAAGTGLGLATCRKIVGRHRGRIWCESPPGRGASIFFTLRPPRGND